MSSGLVEDCANALDAFYTHVEDDNSLVSLPLMLSLATLLSATEKLIADCRRAQDEGDWA